MVNKFMTPWNWYVADVESRALDSTEHHLLLVLHADYVGERIAFSLHWLQNNVATCFAMSIKSKILVHLRSAQEPEVRLLANLTV